LVLIVGCDKTIPAAAMALCRLDLPGVILYGGTIDAGQLGSRSDLTVQDVFEAVGAFNAGRIDDSDLRAIEEAACAGAGACGGQYTANTMSGAVEFLGLSIIGANGIPARDAAKVDAAEMVGRLAMKVVTADLRPRSVELSSASTGLTLQLAELPGSHA
jgi:dihydroxy-acid dehydratase